MPSHPLESEAHPSTAPPPEAVLIRRAREARGLGYEAAAEQLKIKLSGRRWRQLEEGREHSGGKPAPISDATLAHMADVVHVPPERLEDVGRFEAAEILREIQRLTKRDWLLGAEAADAELDEADRALDARLRQTREIARKDTARRRRLEQYLDLWETEKPS